MKKLLFIILLCAAASSACAAVPSLAGKWKLDPARSSPLSYWQTIRLDFSIDGDKVRLVRTLGTGDDSSKETYDLDMTKADNVCPLSWYAENRYMGVYIGGDKAMHIRPSWLDEGRTLRLDANMTVDVQQGSKTMNILSDYKLSANGAELTVIEIRGARTRPLVYVFTRDSADAKQ